jgi:hypothetical protein
MADYKRPPVTEETKQLIDERKPSGVSYDFFLKHAVQHAPPLEGQE